ncbi:MAG: dihydroneopterin aldolase [Maricaulaceae bacterium]|nr:dihydroneopterin aldolase [Maricaulaceae bacterium]
MADVSIELRGLRVPVALGVHDFERKARQDVTVDVTIALAAPPRSDRIGDTVHYDELAEAIQKVADARHYDLIETLALAVAERVKAFAHAAAVEVRVGKTPRTVACERLFATVRL